MFEQLKRSSLFVNLNLKRHQFFVVLLLAYLVSLLTLAKHSSLYPYGDAPEYIIMTESFLNHGTPNVLDTDIENYLSYNEKLGVETGREGHYTNYLNRPKNSLIPMPFPGYWLNNQEPPKWYSYHFWFYSLYAVPFRYILGEINGDIRLSFIAANLFLLFLAFWVISTMKRIATIDKLLLCSILGFSPVLWYIDWAHTEVFSAVLVYLGAVLFYYDKKIWSLLLFSLASMQNQPIAIVLIFVIFDILRSQKLNFKLAFKIVLACFWCIVPSLFYYYNFGSFNLISSSGLLDVQFISLKRFWHFFFDLNQGAVLGVPLFLIVLCFVLLKDLLTLNYRRSYFLLLSIPVMLLLIMQMSVWNDGNAVIKRYASWVIPLFLVPLYFRLKYFSPVYFYTITLTCILVQPFIIFSQKDFGKVLWHANQFSPIAKLVFSHYPHLYNPEPELFINRTNPYTLSTTDSVVVFTNEKEEITKMLVKKGALNQLKERGVNADKVDSLALSLNYYHGYTYLNKKDLEDIGYVQENDDFIALIEKRKLNEIRLKIKDNILSDYSWLLKIKEQSQTLGISLDSCITLNVDYLISQGLKDE